MPGKTKQSIAQRLNPKRLDFIGSEFQLNYTKNGRYQTKLGGLISLLVVIFMLMVVYSTFKTFLSTNAPVATISTVYSKIAPKFDLYKEQIFFHFAFRNKGIVERVKDSMHGVDRFITVKGYILSDMTDSATGRRRPVYTLTLNYKPCGLVKDRSVVDYFQWHQQTAELVDNFGLCPELEGGQEKYFVQSKMQEPPSHALRIFVFPCSLPNKEDCAPLSEFKGLELIQTNTKKAFDASNFEKPLSTELEIDGIFQLEPHLSKMVYYRVRDNEVWDDTRDFFDRTLKAKSSDYFLNYRDSRLRNHSQVHCDAEVLDQPLQTQCEPYFSFDLGSSGEKKIIVRTYTKFFMSLGEVGGTAEILTLFALIIYYKYNWFFLQRFVHNEIFEEKSVSKLDKILFGPRESHYGKNESNSGIRKLNIGARHNTTKKSPLEAESVNIGPEEDTSSRKTEKKRGKEGSQKVKGLLAQYIEHGLDGISLFKSLDELKILSKIFFKARHKKLLPIVLLNLMHKENEEKEKALRSHKNTLAYAITKSEENMSMEQAYDQLSSHGGSSNLIEGLIDDFVLENLPDYFSRQNEAQRGSRLAKPSSGGSAVKLGGIESGDLIEPGTPQNLVNGSIRRSSDEEEMRGFPPNHLKESFAKRVNNRNSRFFRKLKNKKRERERERGAQ